MQDCLRSGMGGWIWRGALESSRGSYFFLLLAREPPGPAAGWARCGPLAGRWYPQDHAVIMWARAVLVLAILSLLPAATDAQMELEVVVAPPSAADVVRADEMTWLLDTFNWCAGCNAGALRAGQSMV